jgi:hypothetical protein
LRETAVELALQWRLRLSTPVIVYQMGKVGSSSITKSLRLSGVRAFHVHRINPAMIKQVREEHLNIGQNPPRERIGAILYENVVKKPRRAKFITLVREPISRNISAFFENFEHFAKVRFEKSTFSICDLVNIFIAEYSHNVPLNWFDQEIKSTLGIDVYKYQFPRDKGYLLIREGYFELLILKCELADSIKERVISEFLNLSNFEVIRKNLAKDKIYAESYQEFLRAISLPESYVETMLNSKYTRHFYTDEEIEQSRSRWSTGVGSRKSG